MSEYVTNDQLTAAGTVIGERIKAAGSGGGGSVSRYPAGLVANRTTEFYTAFLSTTPWDSFWVGTQTGSGAVGTTIAVDTANNDASYLRLETGTTATGRGQVFNGTLAFRAKAGCLHKFKTRVAFIDGASDVTNTYEAVIGFANIGTLTPAYGAYFRMNTAGVFQAVCRNNGTESTVNLDAPSSTPTAYEVIIDGISEARFYIEGVLVATITAQLPSNSFTYTTVHIRKTIGTVTRRLRCYFLALQSTMP